MGADAIPLRVGICSCDLFYQRQLWNREVEISSLTGAETHSAAQPLCFRLQEYLIQERNQRQELKLARCHFFLDVHKGWRFDECWIRDECHITLALNMLISNGAGRGERLYVGGTRYLNVADIMMREWLGWILPPADDIVAGIAELMGRFKNEERLMRWLSSMSPAERASV